MDTRETIEAWHAALNAADVDRLLELSATDIVVGGPRSAGGTGHDLLVEWLDRAGIQLEPVAVHGDGPTMVVEQEASWPNADRDATMRVASIVEVADGRVTRIERFGSREEAEAALPDG